MIPTTVFTGQLGAGKTTIILNLIKQLPPDYKVMWLKNEYGDVNVDSELAKADSIQTTEILNGCICCVLVGKLHDALTEIAEKYELDRLIIETAGTAYPFPVLNQINKVSKLRVDGLVNVVDALNFEHFKDKSYLARKESQYVDLVVINKAGEISEQQLYEVEEEVYDLYQKCPKHKTKDGVVPKEIVFGLSKSEAEKSGVEIQNSELEAEDMKSDNRHPISEYRKEHEHIDVFSYKSAGRLQLTAVNELLEKHKDERFYRIKGIVNTQDGPQILNYVFGKIDWMPIEKYDGETVLTFMGDGTGRLESKIIEELKLLDCSG